MDDPKKLLQEANGYLRTAQNNMFSGKNAEAVDLLNKADDLGTRVKQIIPDDFQVTSLFQKIEKMRKDLERKGVATRPGGNDQLPFEVQAQLNRVRDLVVRKELDQARRELNNYYARFAGPMTDLAAIQEIKAQLEVLEKEAAAHAAQQAAAQQANAAKAQELEALSRQWEDRLRAIPYFDGGVHNVPGLLDHQKAWQMAKEVMSEYQGINFYGNQSITLESMARDIQQRSNMFQSNLKETLASMSGEIQETIEERVSFLNNDTAWINNTAQKPYIISKRELDGLFERVGELRPLYAADPAGLDPLNNAMARLIDLNNSRKSELAKRITMQPEALTGNEATEAIDAAMAELNRHYQGAKLLKLAVTRNWEHKRVENWADNTRSQWVVKNIAETSVQIAIVPVGGTCKLITFHVEKEKAHDGTFGKPTSHIMYEDEAIESNFI